MGSPVLYIAMELVAGETFRKAIEARRLDPKRALEYLVQVADAVAAAHAAGVIHRDLKPENLMIADGGYAKVLDFGVAKLRADMVPPDETAAPSVEGAVIGTVGYMSPEQVHGKALDTRTDIFSFGCVLYEVITGRRAFQGTTSFETLKQNPDRGAVADRRADSSRRAPADHPEVPGEESRRSLSIDAGAGSGSARAAASPGGGDASRGGESHPVASSACRAAGIVIAAVAVWWAAERRFIGRAPARVTIERLTLSGTAIDAATSRDGRYLAWVESVGGMQGLRVRQLGEDRSIELVPPAAVGFWGIAFSLDGSRVFYATKSAQEPSGRLYVTNVIVGHRGHCSPGSTARSRCLPTERSWRTTELVS
jgi:hypothetical protein